MEEDYEQTLLVVKEVFVFKIPPRLSAAGHKAGEWDLTSPLWTGRLVVLSIGDVCKIKLEDPNTGDLFAVCPVHEASVEPVSDSSRYFVIRIQDGSGRHAFIGLGFTERNDAFDFSAALQDHQKYVAQKKEAAEANKRLASQPQVDYSLPTGAMIHVELKNVKTTKENQSVSSGASQSSGSGLFLPPPPGHKKTSSGSSTLKSNTPTSNSTDFWGDFSSASPSPQPKPIQQQPTDWVAFQ